MKKILMLLVTLTALCAVGCKEPPKKAYATVTSNLGTPINEQPTVDPREIEYINITFDKPMDWAGGFFYEDDEPYDVLYGEWKSYYVYTYHLNLSYNTNFNIAINPRNRNDTDVFWIDRDGEYANEVIINFNTIPYPTPDREPKEFVIDFTDPNTYQLLYKICRGQTTASLSANKYDVSGNETSNPDNQQYVFPIKNYLNKEILLQGDKLTIKYKIQSSSDLSKIKANLIDNSYEADPKDCWLELSTDKDLVIAPDYTPNSVYEGELTFNITESMKRLASIQLYALYEDLKENASIAFVLD